MATLDVCRKKETQTCPYGAYSSMQCCTASDDDALETVMFDQHLAARLHMSAYHALFCLCLDGKIQVGESMIVGHQKAGLVWPVRYHKVI